MATGWTPQGWESAMETIQAATKKKHKYQPRGGRKGAPCIACGLGASAPVHNDPDNDGDNDPPGQPDTDAEAPPASHRTCKGCGAHMATDAGTCPSCGAKWSASDALEDAKTPSGANAPYKIVKKGDKFAVVNNTGATKSSFDTYAEALKYLRALYVNVPGASKRADSVKFSGKGKDRVPAKGDS